MDEMDCFLNVGDRRAFVTQHERARIVRTLLSMIRAPSGGRQMVLSADEVTLILCMMRFIICQVSGVL
jgi:hypothetical protein